MPDPIHYKHKIPFHTLLRTKAMLATLVLRDRDIREGMAVVNTTDDGKQQVLSYGVTQKVQHMSLVSANLHSIEVRLDGRPLCVAESEDIAARCGFVHSEGRGNIQAMALWVRARFQTNHWNGLLHSWRPTS